MVAQTVFYNSRFNRCRWAELYGVEVLTGRRKLQNWIENTQLIWALCTYIVNNIRVASQGQNVANAIQDQALAQFFAELWRDYTAAAPMAADIAALFTAQGHRLINDHVAFRTISDSPIGLSQLEKVLAQLGYQAYDSFRFEQKKLNAKAYRWRDPDAAPKIFLSELQLTELAQPAAEVIKGYIEHIAVDTPLRPALLYQGRLWPTPRWQDYQLLSSYSEYAAWLMVMGLRANHFTVSVNHLNGQPSLEEVNRGLKQSGFALNAVGGEIKRGPPHTLEQSATLADRQPYRFAGGEVRDISTCFYEFALRHTLADGKVYSSFVEGNADKIFASTNSQQTQ